MDYAANRKLVEEEYDEYTEIMLPKNKITNSFISYSEEDKLTGASSSLFELVTRGGRSAINSISQGVKEVGGDERLEESDIEPSTDLKVEMGGNDKMAHEENKELTQPYFGEIKEGKDSQNVDEGDDLLDIPAFLRRQAN